MGKEVQALKDKVVSFLANMRIKDTEIYSKVDNSIKWVEIAKCFNNISMSKFLLFIDSDKFVFACDIAIVVTPTDINCIGISSDTLFLAFDPESKDLYIGFKYDSLPDDYGFNYDDDRNVNIKYLDKLIPQDKIPEGSIVKELNK